MQQYPECYKQFRPGKSAEIGNICLCKFRIYTSADKAAWRIHSFVRSRQLRAWKWNENSISCGSRKVSLRVEPTKYNTRVGRKLNRTPGREERVVDAYS